MKPPLKPLRQCLRTLTLAGAVGALLTGAAATASAQPSSAFIPGHAGTPARVLAAARHTVPVADRQMSSGIPSGLAPLVQRAMAGRVTSPTRKSPWTDRAELNLGSGAAEGDNAGFAVAISKDGSTAILGAPGRTVNGQAQAGAAEVFTVKAGRWIGPTELSLGIAARSQDGLGTSVALSGDGHVALVGAAGKTVNGQLFAGAAEVFKFNQGGWEDPVELNLGAAAQSQDELGSSVAISGNGATALVGAPNLTVNGQSESGAGEVFTFVRGAWKGPVELGLGARAQTQDLLGTSVALGGQGHTALLGAPGRTVKNRSQAGAAEIFTLGGGRWSRPTELSLEANAVAFDSLGASVALSREAHSALVGAPNRTVNQQSQAGAAELWTLNRGSWMGPTQMSLKSKARAQDSFGTSVALDGNGQTAVIGVPGRSVSGHADAGTADVFSGADAWSAATELSLRASSAFDALGAAVALSGPGRSAIAGAPGRTISGRDYAGSAQLSDSLPSLTVTVHSFGTYGTAPRVSSLSPADPAISYSPTGQGGNVRGALTCDTTATSTSPVTGLPYPISSCRGLADAGFNVEYDYQHSGYVVDPAHLVVTGDRQSTVYGSKIPTLTWHANFAANDTPNSLTTQPLCTTKAAAGSPVGTYTTTCGGAADPNYHITYASGFLQINPAPLVISAQDVTVRHGHKLPRLTWSADFVHDDSAASLKRQPSCGTTVAVDSHGNVDGPAGSYPITCWGAQASNYTISYRAALLTVSLEPVFVVYSGPTKLHRGQIARTSAFLISDLTAPVVSRQITFIVRPGPHQQTCTGKTDGNGLAKLRDQSHGGNRQDSRRGALPRRPSGDNYDYSAARSFVVTTVAG